MMMSSGNQADALASLRVAAESRQIYNQALMNRIAATHQQQSSFMPHELLGYSQAAHLQQGNSGVPPSDLYALAAARSNAPSGLSMNPAYLAAAAASGGGNNQASSGANSALTRHYLQLLRDRHETGFNNTNNSANPSGGGGDGDSAS